MFWCSGCGVCLCSGCFGVLAVVYVCVVDVLVFWLWCMFVMPSGCLVFRLCCMFVMPSGCFGVKAVVYICYT